LCVRKDQEDILRKVLEQYVLGEKDPSFDFGNITLCNASLLHIAIRMIWPGRTHKVYSDPRGIKGSAKPAFHSLRLELAGKYLNKLFGECCDHHNLDQEHHANNKSPEQWATSVHEQFDRLRTKSYYRLAIELGLGEPWFRKHFQARTKPTCPKDDGGGQVQCFEKYIKQKRQQKPKKRPADDLNDNDDDDDDDFQDDDDDDFQPQPKMTRRQSSLLASKQQSSSSKPPASKKAKK
jgi:hypothetical protein